MNFAENGEGETLSMTYESKKVSNTEVWFIDTECNNDMSRCKSFFSYLDKLYESTISFGDNSVVQVKGNIKLNSLNGFVENIIDVQYVPALKRSLLSLSQL